MSRKRRNKAIKVASDEEIATLVGSALLERRRESLRRIEVSVRKREITLRGTVPSFFDRQLAIATVLRIPGALGVTDEIEVRSAADRETSAELSEFVTLDSKDARVRPSAARIAAPPPQPTATGTRAAVISTSVVIVLLASLIWKFRDDPDRLKLYALEGRVTLNGQPLPDAFVVLHPRQTGNPRIIAARGKTDGTGRYRLSTFDANDGAAAGLYAVTVQYHPLVRSDEGPRPGPNILPPKLANPDTTDIVVMVDDGLKELQSIDLRR